jgi:AI-2E family transporter
VAHARHVLSRTDVYHAIPTIGAKLGAVICVLVALPTTALWPNTALLAVFFVLYQQLENYAISPRIMRKTIELRTGAVLLAGLIRGTALGLIGALMAIPVAAAVTVLLVGRLQARDEADTDPTTAGEDEGAPPPGPANRLITRRRPGSGHVPRTAQIDRRRCPLVSTLWGERPPGGQVEHGW